jgi:xylulose-5-phosphate/fructose-6-phosphate phosphoketolase
VTVVIGDGEAETGPLATAWHGNKFLNPVRDGAVLPVLNLNGYKINNPTVLARISHEELDALLRGYGWTPHFVEGDEPQAMHQAMAAALEALRAIGDPPRSRQARQRHGDARPRWPMIVLRTPKGWTGPKRGWPPHRGLVARAPGAADRGAREPRASAPARTAWLRSLPARGTVRCRRPLRAAARTGAARRAAHERQSARQRRPAAPRAAAAGFRDYAVRCARAGASAVRATRVRWAALLRDTLRANPDQLPRVRSRRDRSNKLDAVYEASKKTWLAEMLPEDADGGELAATAG